MSSLAQNPTNKGKQKQFEQGFFPDVNPFKGREVPDLKKVEVKEVGKEGFVMEFPGIGRLRLEGGKKISELSGGMVDAIWGYAKTKNGQKAGLSIYGPHSYEINFNGEPLFFTMIGAFYPPGEKDKTMKEVYKHIRESFGAFLEANRNNTELMKILSDNLDKILGDVWKNIKKNAEKAGMSETDIIIATCLFIEMAAHTQDSMPAIFRFSNE